MFFRANLLSNDDEDIKVESFYFTISLTVLYCSFPLNMYGVDVLRGKLCKQTIKMLCIRFILFV